MGGEGSGTGRRPDHTTTRWYPHQISQRTNAAAGSLFWNLRWLCWRSFGVYLTYPDIPLKIYINDHYLYTRGVYENGTYFVPTAQPCVFFIPEDLLEEVNIFRIEIPPLLDDTYFFYVPNLTGPEEISYRGNFLELLNADLFLLFAAVCLVGGLYFFFIWLVNRQVKGYFYFALSSVFMAVYFFGIGSPFPLFFSNSYLSIMRMHLFFSVGFLLLFFLEYFKIHNNRNLKRSILVLYALVGLFVGLSPTPQEGNGRFTLALIPIQLAITMFLYILIRAIKRKNPDAVTILLGTITGVALGTHDVVYQIAGYTPDVWLQGLGFFALQASLLLSLALHSLRLYVKLEDFSGKLILQKKTLADTNAAYERFVPKELLSLLGKSSAVEVQLGDQVQKDMTVLFSDLRDFTALSEVITPEENFNLLNSYLGQMAPIIRRNGGIIDKYIGDAIMALFPKTPFQAFEAAQTMRNKLQNYNTGRQRAGYQPLEMGIGLHYGSLMLGMIGERNRMDGTVISDAVNTASRLEDLTKTYRVPILTSEHTLNIDPDVKNTFAHRYLGSVPVKGKLEILKIYEVFDPSDEYFEAKYDHRELFSQAVKAQESGDTKGSQKLFKEYRSKNPLDTVLPLFLKS
jgi:adenylate cyclase